MDSLPAKTNWHTGRRQYWSPHKRTKQFFLKGQQPPGWSWVREQKPKRPKMKDFTDLEWKEYIYQRVLIHPVTGCWIWQKALLKPSKANPSGGGYGMMGFYKGDQHKMRLVHTVAYELWVGPIPPGRDICHHDRLCTSKACCNPDHLYAGTVSQNLNDAIASGAWTPGEYRKGTLGYSKDGGKTRRFFKRGSEPKGWTRLAGKHEYFVYTSPDRSERVRCVDGEQPAGWVRAYKSPKNTAGGHWYTNGTKDRYWLPGKPIPSADDGWRPGRSYLSKNKENNNGQV